MVKKKNNLVWGFLKPTKWKIILVVLLTLILIILPYLGEVTGTISFYTIFIPILLLDFFSVKSGGDVVSDATLLSMIIGLLAYLIEVYFISCLIVWIFKKFKGERYEKK